MTRACSRPNTSSPRLGEPRSFNAWYHIGDLRPGIEASVFQHLHADMTARRAEATSKADRPRYLLATHGAHVFDTVLPASSTISTIAELPSPNRRTRSDGPLPIAPSRLPSS
jgi:hypothetical protein